ncbi:uncharacterized protein EV420DRAFT_1765808 [Desarmillaria tabescens]|uniref:F-box domain-containing protein n=1 Tax=Armillaria tabescens TaxID=1929756 RepID=A0AA39K6R7_ARMTA|nr:uncharacterized protein EV420DRAFT_1765808 [Desarmillaria tabescens]KAK0454254.1 hypothetical protein EV420DRAFT_1765808 [Desarmillaria tabescens]
MAGAVPQGGFLSPEIVDKIIDQVHLFPPRSSGWNEDDDSDDEEAELDRFGDPCPKDRRLSTLLSCSLVCRTWLPRSRYHIFGTTSVSFYNHASFMRLLDSPRCTFFTSVYTLHLDENMVRNDPDRPDDLEPGYYWLHHTLPTGFLFSFPELKTLRISGARFDWASDLDLEDLLGPCDLQGVPNLTLSCCHFRNLADLAGILSSCAALVSAHLQLVCLVDPRVTLPTKFALLSPLPESLTSLKINLYTHPSLVQLISRASTSLKHLSIGIADSTTVSNPVEPLIDNIKYCSNLESVAFCPIHLQSYSREKCYKHIPIILQTITSSSITDIIMSVCANSVDDFDIFNWKSIAEILSQKKYASLQRITVDNVKEKLVAEAKKKITTKLKGLLARNPSVEIIISNDVERHETAFYGR